MPNETDDWRVAVESRITGLERLSNLLKDELSGLNNSISSLLAASRETTNALTGHHQAYAAASLRAEYAEDRAVRAERRVETLERELAQLRIKPPAAKPA